MVTVVPIVEGHGEVEAVPMLVRRVGVAVAPGVAFEVSKPIRVSRSRLLKPNELERGVQLAARKGGPDGRILVLLDADDDCPAELAPSLLARAAAVQEFSRLRLVLAKAEYESWFIAAADSVAGRRGLRPDVTAPADPESIRDAKGWLTEQMTGGHSYHPTLDQPALTAAFALHLARQRSPSFDKFCRDVEWLLT